MSSSIELLIEFFKFWAHIFHCEKILRRYGYTNDSYVKDLIVYSENLDIARNRFISFLKDKQYDKQTIKFIESNKCQLSDLFPLNIEKFPRLFDAVDEALKYLGYKFTEDRKSFISKFIKSENIEKDKNIEFTKDIEYAEMDDLFDEIN